MGENVVNLDGKIEVVFGTVTDDVRVYEVPALKVCALRFTELLGFTLRRRAVNASLLIGWHLEPLVARTR